MYIIVYLVFCFFASASNVYFKTFTSSESDKGSLFGYAVDLIQTSDGPELLIGAPKMKNKNVEVGAAFKCSIINEECKRIDIRSDDVDDIEGQMLGGAVSSFNDTYVICAPRWYYIEKTTPYVHGICYWSKNGSSSLLPSHKQNLIYDDKKAKKRKLYCALGQKGFSTHFTESGKFLLGAPGSAYYKGNVFNFSNFKDSPDITNTFNFHELSSFSYMGYSISSSKDLIITGAPRGNSLLGQVYIYRSGKYIFNKYKVNINV